jgi:hypothetical protein
MDENTKVIENVEVISKKRLITFDKPYMFETVTYKEIDLSKLDDLTTDDLMNAERIYNRSGGTAINPETSLLYSVILAHLASDMPIEFFGKLPAKESFKLKREVYNFFYRGA